MRTPGCRFWVGVAFAGLATVATVAAGCGTSKESRPVKVSYAEFGANKVAETKDPDRAWICVEEAPTGTRFKKLVCRTPREMDRAREQAQEIFRRPVIQVNP